MENKIKHLEMIENIIERMAKNCFELKGLTITLLVLIISLAGEQTAKTILILLIFIPIIFFGVLDAYYRQMERKYKALYKCVAKKPENEIDFNMDTSVDEVKAEGGKRLGLFNCMGSPSISVFYGPVIIVMVIILILLRVK